MDTEVVQAPKFRRPSFIRAVMRLRLGRAGFSLALFLIFVVQLPPSSPLLYFYQFPFLCVYQSARSRELLRTLDTPRKMRNAEFGTGNGMHRWRMTHAVWRQELRRYSFCT